MNKQEFLAMSLPYGIYLLEDAHISKLEGIVQGYYLIDYNEIGTEERDDVLPVLHPLSDLTKEIEHKGEKFVPMVELAKMIIDLPDYAPYCFTTKTSTFLQSDKHEFGYNHQGQSFHLFERELMEHKSFPNQLGLFLKLIEWHFDIADLISKGEAIDVNTLPENPYK